MGSSNPSIHWMSSHATYPTKRILVGWVGHGPKNQLESVKIYVVLNLRIEPSIVGPRIQSHILCCLRTVIHVGVKRFNYGSEGQYLKETNIGIENGDLWWIYLFKMGMFKSYVSFPEGKHGAHKLLSTAVIDIEPLALSEHRPPYPRNLMNVSAFLCPHYIHIIVGFYQCHP